MKEIRIGRVDKTKPGLYANILAKKKRIAAGSGEEMNEPSEKESPSASEFEEAAKTAKPKQKKDTGMRTKYDKVKKSCACSNKDKGMKKSPYADGCGYKEDSLAQEFEAILGGLKPDAK